MQSRTISNATAHTVLYVSETDTNAVYTFDPSDISAGPTGKVTTGINYPRDLAVAPDNVLYVANGGNITLYKPGANAPFKTIVSKFGQPDEIAISADDTIAIAYGGGIQKSGELVVYDKGSLSPTRNIFVPLLHTAALLSLVGLEIDASDNIYLSITRYPNGPAAMLKFAAGSNTGVNTGLLPDENGGFDSAGNLYAGELNVVCEYAPGAKLCTRRITNNGLSQIGLFAVAPSGELFVTNLDHYVEGIPTNGDVVEYAPGGSTPIATYAAPGFINPTAAALGSIP